MLPVNLLMAAQGQTLLVELKDGTSFNGTLVNTDSYMNINLKEVTCTSKEGDRFWSIPELYVRGSMIKYFRLPDDLFDSVPDDDGPTGGQRPQRGRGGYRGGDSAQRGRGGFNRGSGERGGSSRGGSQGNRGGSNQRGSATRGSGQTRGTATRGDRGGSRGGAPSRGGSSSRGAPRGGNKPPADE